jgi:hypothetical protein
VPVLDDDDQRRPPADRGEEVGDRAVQAVALRVGIGRDRRRQLADPVRGQEPRELPAAGAEVGPRRGSIGRPHELVERLHERPVRPLHDRVTGAVEHEHAAGSGLTRELADKAALAGSSLAADEREPDTLSLGPRDQRPQCRQLARAPGERKRRRQAKRTWELGHVSSVSASSQV